MTRARSLVVLALIAMLAAIAALGGCSGTSSRSKEPLLPSEKRLEGMYEHCKTIVVIDGSGKQTIKTADLPALGETEVSATLVRSNGMHIKASWKGTPLNPVLDKLAIARPFKELKVKAWDGYVGRVSYDVATRGDTMLAREQDGKPLPKEDGPVRLVVPSEDGFYWIRMITEIEVLR